MKRIITLLTLLAISPELYSQGEINGISLEGRQTAVVQTAVPFLTITPDSRAGAMGDAGVATTPDAYSNHWNPSKIAFAENSSIGFSYSPWLSQIASDIHLTYLSGFHQIDDLSGFGLSMRYFSLGDITFTDEIGDWQGDHRPYEMAIDGSYARKLSDRFSIGVGLRYIYSNLTGGHSVGGVESNPGQSVAGDISAFYTRDRELFGYDGNLSFGANFSNLGAKVTYTEDIESSFLPANMRLGTSATIDIDDFNSFTTNFDVNKLLVPTNPTRDEDGNIIDGMDPDVPVMQGVVQSFYDAPGGFDESIKEFMPSVGFEWWYNEQFAARAGYFYEHPAKGNRQYVTAGLGLRYNVLGIDFAYLLTTNRSAGQTNPLDNTLRFSLSLLIDEGGIGDIHGDNDASASRIRF